MRIQKNKKIRRRKKYIVFASGEDAGIPYRPTWADKREPQPNTLSNYLRASAGRMFGLRLIATAIYLWGQFWQ